MDVVIVCHTEFGFVSKDKAVIFDKKVASGATEGVLNLEKMTKKYKAKITFAVMPEVFEKFPKVLSHEIGLHVHPGWQEFSNKNFKWMVGDSFLKENCTTNKTSTLLSDYGYQEQFEIIKTAKDYFARTFSFEPKVFLAGRWSENKETPRALEELGFTHDCSAYPGLSNWENLPRMCLPYKSNGILQVPVSRMIFKGSACIEEIRRFGLWWLKACFLEYYLRGSPVFHLALHSPTMTDNFYISGTDKLLSFIASKKNINFKFVSEI